MVYGSALVKKNLGLGFSFGPLRVCVFEGERWFESHLLWVNHELFSKFLHLGVPSLTHPSNIAMFLVIR